jgi:hypothetical protein
MVQVKFCRKGQLPGLISQTIDYDFDNNPDFTVTINTLDGNTQFTPVNRSVRSLWASARVKEDWVIRVNLEK